MILVNGNVVDTAKGRQKKIEVSEEKVSIVIRDLFGKGMEFRMRAALEARSTGLYWYASRRAGRVNRETKKAYIGKYLTARGILKAQQKFREYDNEK